MVRLFFDTETTGLPKDYNAPSSALENWPRLVQLSWELYNEQTLVGNANLIIKPEGFKIPAQSSDVHGITTERALAEGVDCKKAVYMFLGAAKLADVIVGHNVNFDMHVVGAELIRHWGKDYIENAATEDTMLASIQYCKIPAAKGPGWKWPKLQELHKKIFGEEFDDAHDSSADVAATARCYFALKEEGIL